MKKVVYIYIYLFLSLCIVVACNRNTVVTIHNLQKGRLHATHELVECGEKTFELDSVSAPKAIYMQFLKMGGRNVLSFLNTYNASLYFYDYDTNEHISTYCFKQDFGNEIRKPGAYYIANEDSVFILDMAKMNLAILDYKKNLLLDKISLKGDEEKDWPSRLPQYNLCTANPIFRVENRIVLTGQLFWSIPSSEIETFLFSASIDVSSSDVKFYHCYPHELYGQDSNWEGGLQTTPYATVSPYGDFVYSFPPSHDLYIAKPYSNTYKKVYGGSNYAENISSIDYQEKRETPQNMVLENYVQQDMYGPILYDQYQGVYYRFIYERLSNQQRSNSISDKNISIIVVDEDFHYLGEKRIGTGKNWNVRNSFVTQEGLNIEYLSPANQDEDYIVFKVFQLK